MYLFQKSYKWLIVIFSNLGKFGFKFMYFFLNLNILILMKSILLALLFIAFANSAIIFA